MSTLFGPRATLAPFLRSPQVRVHSGIPPRRKQRLQASGGDGDDAPALSLAEQVARAPATLGICLLLRKQGVRDRQAALLKGWLDAYAAACPSSTTNVSTARADTLQQSWDEAYRRACGTSCQPECRSQQMTRQHQRNAIGALVRPHR